MEPEKELIKGIQSLNASLKKSNSVWWSFLRGVMNGFGVFVGSAILVGLLLFVLSHVEGWAYIGRYAHNIMNLIRASGK